MNNEEKILEILEKLSKTQEEQSALLKEHSTLLKDHSAALKELKRDMLELNNRSLRSALSLEGTVIPRLQLLFEGQENLRQTLAPREDTENLSDEVHTMQAIIKSMAERLTALEKAQ